VIINNNINVHGYHSQKYKMYVLVDFYLKNFFVTILI